MKDMVHALHVAPDFLAAIDIVLVEESAVLRTLQRQRLEGTPLPIRWVRQWTEIMADRPLYVLANEFLDALPIRQFVKTDRGWCERMVTVNEAGNLNFALAPDPTPIAPAAERGHEQAGVVYEISPAAQALAEEVSGAIAAQGGAALFIDYGHDGSGFGDTLQAVRRHTPADVLQAPGEADLSAHVDFAALARAASTAPVRVYGPISQGDFLQGLGIEARGAALMRKNPAAAAEVAQAVERLTAASRMGTLFKALAIGPRDQPPLPGF
jgi:SAM-dependent MidA family methyltransferase